MAGGECDRSLNVQSFDRRKLGGQLCFLAQPHSVVPSSPTKPINRTPSPMSHAATAQRGRHRWASAFITIVSILYLFLLLNATPIYSHRLGGRIGQLTPPTAVGIPISPRSSSPLAEQQDSLDTQNPRDSVAFLHVDSPVSAGGGIVGEQHAGSSLSPIGLPVATEDHHVSTVDLSITPPVSPGTSLSNPLGSSDTAGHQSDSSSGATQDKGEVATGSTTDSSVLPVAAPGAPGHEDSSSNGTGQVETGPGHNEGQTASSDVTDQREAASPLGLSINTGETTPPSSVSRDPAVSTAVLAAVDPDNVPTAQELQELQEKTVSSDHQTIKKPTLDTTQYAAFNMRDLGLKGLVAVDSTQEAGAFAVSVGCGYFHDPPELPGLAHMLEHMIFLGSSSRSQATGWDELISSKGGLHNAHTKPDVTTFYVSAPTRHIPELLDAFLDHLLRPALLADQVQSEAMAVQYEHEKNVPDLERVALHLALKYLPDSGTAGASRDSANPVSGKFGTGSVETLCNKPTKNGIDMLASMRKFHEKCYVPSNMSIALRMGITGKGNIQRQHSLSDAIDIVSTIFRENVKGSNTSFRGKATTSFVELEGSPTSQKASGASDRVVKTASGKRKKVNPGDSQVNVSEKADGKTDLPQGSTILLLRAHGWRRKLFVFWGAPSEVGNNVAELECQPSSLVQYLLEHPMEEGLFDTLKRQGFISKGEVFKNETTRSSILGLALDTTNKGESQHEDLMGIIRQFVKSMQKTVDESFVREYFANYASLSELLWKFQDPLSPLDQVVTSAEMSLQYPSRPDMALNTGVCLSMPSEDALYREVRRLVEAMAPGKEVIVKLQMSDSSSDERFLDIDEYKVKYLVKSNKETIPDDRINLKVPKPLACKMPEAQVESHPPPAVCLSFSAHLPTISTEASNRPKGSRQLAASPCTLVSDDNLSIVWHNGSPFNKPVVRAFTKARLMEGEATALNDAFGKIFTHILADRAKLRLSGFHGCGVDLVVAYTGGSLVFELQSFSSIFEEVSKGLGAAFKDTIESLTENEFGLAVAALKEDMSDFSASTSYELAMDVALSIVRQSRFSQFDLKEQLFSPDLTFDNFKDFIRGSLGKTAIDSFIMGDIEASKAKAVALDFADHIRTEAINYEEAAGTKTLNLTSDVEVKLKNPIPGDVNHAFVSLYISDPPDILESVMHSLIGQMISAPFFDTVRTTNMDGYVASASVSELPPVSVLGTIVQSSLRKPEELEDHVCKFLHRMTNTIGSSLTSEEFQQRVAWIGRGTFAREQSSFAEFFSGIVSQISSRCFCFIKTELAALVSENFVRCPDSIKRYLTKLVRGDGKHRITVKLEAASSDRGNVQPTGQSKCILPGQPTATSNPLAGLRQTPPARDVGTVREGSVGKNLVEQRNTEQETNQQAAEVPQNKEAQIRNGPLAAPDNSAASSPETVDVKTVAAGVSHATQLGGDPTITTVGASDDAALGATSVPEKNVQDDKDEFKKALEYCKNEKSSSSRETIILTKFAERPQEERQRLLSTLQSQHKGNGSSSSGASSSVIWTGYNFETYCTVHESSVRETNSCRKSKDEGSRIITEDDNWVQLANKAADNKAQDGAKTRQQSTGASVENSEPAAPAQMQGQGEGPKQQLALLQRLQQQLLATVQQRAAANVSPLMGFLSPQASTLQQPVYPYLQLQQQQALPTANGSPNDLGNLLVLLQQQQQQFMQPSMSMLRRYGSLPSVVFASSGPVANVGTSRNQPLLEGGFPRALTGVGASRLYQAMQRQLEILQARRQVVEQRINDIQQEVLLNAPTATVEQAQA